MPLASLTAATKDSYWTTVKPPTTTLDIVAQTASTFTIQWDLGPNPAATFTIIWAPAATWDKGSDAGYVTADKVATSAEVTAGKVSFRLASLQPNIDYRVGVLQKVTTAATSTFGSKLTYPDFTLIDSIQGHARVTPSITAPPETIGVSFARLPVVGNASETYRIILKTPDSTTTAATVDNKAVNITTGVVPSGLESLQSENGIMNPLVLNLPPRSAQTAVLQMYAKDNVTVYDVDSVAFTTNGLTLTLQSISTSSIQASWTQPYPNGGAKFQLRYKKKDDPDTAAIKVNDLTGLSYLIEGLELDTAYHVEVYVVERGTPLIAANVPLGASWSKQHADSVQARRARMGAYLAMLGACAVGAAVV